MIGVERRGGPEHELEFLGRVFFEGRFQLEHDLLVSKLSGEDSPWHGNGPVPMGIGPNHDHRVVLVLQDGVLHGLPDDRSRCRPYAQDDDGLHGAGV